MNFFTAQSVILFVLGTIVSVQLQQEDLLDITDYPEEAILDINGHQEEVYHDFQPLPPQGPITKRQGIRPLIGNTILSSPVSTNI